MTAHGGDVWRASDEFGIPVSEILDFSANVNPRGLPPAALARLTLEASDPRGLSLYPDPDARNLRAALSAYLHVPTDAIVVGPGAEALLSPMLRCLNARRVHFRMPAFSEYRRVCAQAGAEYVPDVSSADVLILNNPHNPTGACLDRAEVFRRAAGVATLVDEAFIDYAPHASVTRDAAGSPNLLVLRSLTKFFGCPALRAGYAVGHPETMARLRALLPAWPITQLALDALTEALADREYAGATLRETAIERERLAAALRALGHSVCPSSANFLLIELAADSPSAPELRERLIRDHHILIRNCDSYEGLAAGRFIRVAVRSAPENARLIEALKLS